MFIIIIIRKTILYTQPYMIYISSIYASSLAIWRMCIGYILHPAQLLA